MMRGEREAEQRTERAESDGNGVRDPGTWGYLGDVGRCLCDSSSVLRDEEEERWLKMTGEGGTNGEGDRYLERRFLTASGTSRLLLLAAAPCACIGA